MEVWWCKTCRPCGTFRLQWGLTVDLCPSTNMSSWSWAFPLLAVPANTVSLALCLVTARCGTDQPRLPASLPAGGGGHQRQGRCPGGGLQNGQASRGGLQPAVRGRVEQPGLHAGQLRRLGEGRAAGGAVSVAAERGCQEGRAMWAAGRHRYRARWRLDLSLKVAGSTIRCRCTLW